MNESLVWDINPVLLRLGSSEVRYYGICFGLAFVTAFAVWNARVRRFGESAAFAEQMLFWSVPAVLIGGRLGFCFFYQSSYYLAHPLQIFAIWDGGIASHGVAIGLTLMLWMFSRRHGITWTRLSDYFAPAIALGVGWVRLGNFFNSEVLGSPASVPWAIVFTRHDLVPRHPAQLYDLLIGPAAWLVLTAVERRNIRPIGSGLIAGTFLTVYFGLRIFVEQYKDFYAEEFREFAPFAAVERWIGVPIHTGQWLSVVPVLLGVFLIVRALKRRAA